MTDKEFIFKLLFRAFLDIRIAAHSQDSWTCFILSDIFHNVPLQLNQANKEEINYADIIASIQMRCEERKCLSWFNNVSAGIIKLHDRSD